MVKKAKKPEKKEGKSKAELEEQIARLMDSENRAKQKSKKYRTIIVDLLHELDAAHDHMKGVQCYECGHFYKESYEKAKKI